MSSRCKNLITKHVFRLNNSSYHCNELNRLKSVRTLLLRVCLSGMIELSVVMSFIRADQLIVLARTECQIC
jgi:hypothetical protein